MTCRGNRHAPVFLDSRDRRKFLALLDDAVSRYRWRCAVYCLMTNHFHIVVETPEPNLGLGMHRLNGIYAQWFNRRRDLRGHLFEDRFHSGLVTSEWHMLELSRYVVLNPVRAGLCSSPDAWPWSSYRATIGRARPPSFLDVGELLANFGSSAEVARASFQQFVQDALRLRHG